MPSSSRPSHSTTRPSPGAVSAVSSQRATDEPVSSSSISQPVSHAENHAGASGSVIAIAIEDTNANEHTKKKEACTGWFATIGVLVAILIVLIVVVVIATTLANSSSTDTTSSPNTSSTTGPTQNYTVTNTSSLNDTATTTTNELVTTTTTTEPLRITLATTVEPNATSTTTSGLVPFDLAKFQPAMNTSRLQYPESSPAAVNAGQFAGYSSNGFQLVDDQYIQFQISSSEGARSELRHDPQFASSNAVERSIQARMKIPQPDDGLVSQFTFLQVHSKEFLGNPSGPLLRVVWIDSRNDKTDWLWANIRKSLHPKLNEYVPLQARPNDFFDIEVRVVNSTLSILMDGRYPNPVYNAYNLSHWDPIQTNYFKAGVYLNYNSTGPVVTIFDELTFTV
mmetsp:Transcript_29271/g.52947  ORF Transcript_29271/g.52947 Transcript_29271/m.52947 type:complete len:395 (+) Transcript_29271:52-1236(+)